MITLKDMCSRLHGRKHITKTRTCTEIIEDDMLLVVFNNHTWAECCFYIIKENVLLISTYKNDSDGSVEEIDHGRHDFNGETEEQGIESLYIQLLKLAGI